MSTDFTPLEYHALMIAGKPSKDLRDRLETMQGQRVDITVRISGAISVAGPSSARVKEPLDTATLLALLIERFGKRRHKWLVEDLHLVCTEYREGGDAPKPSAEAVELAEDILAVATREKTQPRRGNVIGALDVTRIDVAADQPKKQKSLLPA